MSTSFYSIQDLRNILTNQDVFVGSYDSPYGSTLLHTTQDDILGLYFVSQEDEIIKINDYFSLKHNLKKLLENKDIINRWGHKIFKSKDKNILFKVSGTDFQINVWQQLLTISLGQTTSYGQIALAIDHPKAMRAVGTAVGANPLSYVIPCHRVLPHNGALGGYRWGSDLKQKILNDEIGI